MIPALTVLTSPIADWGTARLAFRDTFSRPVRRIRFLGLFDTVNSVPHFETAFLQRSKFPYTAKSSAIVIRHAVSINERRAKFRQDLVSGSRQQADQTLRAKSRGGGSRDKDAKNGRPTVKKGESRDRVSARHPSLAVPNGMLGEGAADRTPAHAGNVQESSRYRRPSRAVPGQSRSPAPDRRRSHSPTQGRLLGSVVESDGGPDGHTDGQSMKSDVSQIRGPHNVGEGEDLDDEEADEALPQDIMEVWFPGEHSVSTSKLFCPWRLRSLGSTKSLPRSYRYSLPLLMFSFDCYLG